VTLSTNPSQAIADRQTMRRGRLLELVERMPSASQRRLTGATSAVLSTVHADLEYLTGWGYLEAQTCSCCGGAVWQLTPAGRVAVTAMRRVKYGVLG